MEPNRKDALVVSFISFAEAAEEIGVHRGTIGRLAEQGRFPSQKTPGGYGRIRRDHWAKFVDSLQTCPSKKK